MYSSISDFFNKNSAKPNWSSISARGTDNSLYFEDNVLDTIKFSEKDYASPKDIDFEMLYKYESLFSNVTPHEFAAFIWFLVFNTVEIRRIFFKLNLPLDDNNHFIQLVGNEKNGSYTLMVFHKRSKKPVLPIDIFKGTKMIVIV